MASFINDVSKVAVSRAATIFFGIGRSILLARWLGPENNGIIAALAVYPSLFISIGSLGIRQSTTYFIGKHIYDETKIKRAISQIWILTSTFSVIVCTVLIRYFSESGTNLLFVLLAVIPIPFNLFNTYNSGIFLGKNQIAVFNRINWIPTALTFLSVVILVVAIPLGISGALLATIIGPLGMFIILLTKNKLLSSFNFSIDFQVIKSLFSLGIIYAIAMFATNINYQINIILLDKFSTSYELGIYTKGANITEYLWQIPMLLSTIVFARSAGAKDGLEFSRKVAVLLRISIILIGIASLILVILARWIIILLYGLEFEPSYKVLQLLMPGVLLMTFFKVLNMDLAGKGKPWIAIISMSPALLLNITINMFLIPRYGARGAAFASACSYSLAAIIFLFSYSKTTKLPIKEIFNFSRKDFTPLINSLKEYIKRRK